MNPRATWFFATVGIVSLAAGCATTEKIATAPTGGVADAVILINGVSCPF